MMLLKLGITGLTKKEPDPSKSDELLETAKDSSTYESDNLEYETMRNQQPSL